MWTFYVHMKTATVRDLRNNFSKLEAWLAEGETIDIRRRNRSVGRLSPPEASPGAVNEPAVDFEARRKLIWGDRCFTIDEVRRMREDELEGDRG
jgi:antitoxin (DNA-binding transcriptional repressor) of toxin-antitoxin stability system